MNINPILWIRALKTKLTRKLRKLQRRALILPPTAPGSLGDDAMITVCIDELRASGFSYIATIELDRECEHRFTRSADATIDMSGYSQDWKHPNEHKFADKLSTFDYFFVVGADVLDGHYSDRGAYRHLLLADIADSLGLKTTLLGFSYNAAPGEQALRMMKKLQPSVRLCTRDPVSYRRLMQHLGRAPIQTADLAFLLKPEEPADLQLKDWLREKKSAGHPLYGVNAIKTSKFFDNDSLATESKYVSFYVSMLSRIAETEPESYFVFIPHDYRSNGIGERPLLSQLIAALPTHIHKRTKLLQSEYNVAEIKWIAGELDFVISSRMHLAIGAIGQATPVFCFEYQGKFQGLFEFIEMPELLSSIQSALSNPHSVIERILFSIKERESLRSQLIAKLPELRQLALKNFDID